MRLQKIFMNRMSKHETFTNQTKLEANEPIQNNSEVGVQSSVEFITEHAENEYVELQKILEDTTVPPEVTDEKLQEDFLNEKKTLREALSEAGAQLKAGINRFFSKPKLGDQEVERYHTYLDSKKGELLRNRIFYAGQDLDNPHADLWKKDLQKYKSPLLGVYGKTGDYLAQIAGLDENSSTSKIAKKIHDLGTINDLRLHVSDAPSAYAGAFINIGDPFKIATGEKKLSKNQKYFKTFVDLVGPERRFVTTLLHESIHALVLYRLNSPKTPEDRLIADKLFTVFNAVKEKISPVERKQYGFTDLDEFMAEFFTSGEFRKTVSNVLVDKKNLDKNYGENYQIEQLVRIKMRNMIEAIFKTPNPADSTAIQGMSHDLIRELTAELLGADIFVEELQEDLETQGIIDLAKKEFAKNA